MFFRFSLFIALLLLLQGAAFGGGEKKYVFGQSEIEALLTGYISEKFGLAEERIRLGRYRYRPVHLPHRPEDIRIEERRGGLRGKKLLLRITFFMGGKKTKNSFISLPFQTLISVVVSTKNLKRGDILTRSDLETKERWTAYRASTPRSLEYFTGRQLRDSLQQGDVLTGEVASAVPLVKKGDLVTLIFERNGIKINTRGVIRGDASRGDTVKVLNSFSKRIVVARVLDKDSVRVEF